MNRTFVLVSVSLLLVASYAGLVAYLFLDLDSEEPRDYPYDPRKDLRGMILPDNSGLNSSIMDSVLLAGDYLVEHIKPDGSWDYEFNASSGKSNGGYNVLRHAGTTYSLGLIFKYGRDLDHYNGTMRTLNRLFSRYLDFEDLDGTEIATVRSHSPTKLGGPALALLALVEVKTMDPTLDYQRELEGLANFVVKMQRPNGSFQCYFGSRENEQSDYYPGEALLALAKYHMMTNDTDVLKALRSGLSYYNEYFSDRYTAYSPWATEAIAYLHSIEGDDDLSRKAYAMANSCKRGQYTPGFSGDPFFTGAFSLKARSSTASRIEAVVDAYLLAFRENDTYPAIRYRRSMDLCASFLMRLQISREEAQLLPEPELSAGGVPNSRYDLTVRIDNVQHTAVVLIKTMVYQRGPHHI